MDEEKGEVTTSYSNSNKSFQDSENCNDYDDEKEDDDDLDDSKYDGGGDEDSDDGDSKDDCHDDVFSEDESDIEYDNNDDEGDNEDENEFDDDEYSDEEGGDDNNSDKDGNDTNYENDYDGCNDDEGDNRYEEIDKLADEKYKDRNNDEYDDNGDDEYSTGNDGEIEATNKPSQASSKSAQAGIISAGKQSPEEILENLGKNSSSPEHIYEEIDNIYQSGHLTRPVHTDDHLSQAEAVVQPYYTNTTSLTRSDQLETDHSAIYQNLPL